MMKHVSESHPNDKTEDIKFGMSVVKQHFSSFSRQIHEAVLIYRDTNILNSKSQYNRCQVPRLSVVIGDKVVQDTHNTRYDQAELDTEVADLRQKQKAKDKLEGNRTKKFKLEVMVPEKEDDNGKVPHKIQSDMVTLLPGALRAETQKVLENNIKTKKHFPIFNFSSNTKSQNYFKFNATRTEETCSNGQPPD